MNNMINLNFRNKNEEELIEWIRNDIGSNNNDHFKTNVDNNLEVQQVPEEYSKLLVFLREQKAETYLEVGVGKGGSFMLNTLIQPNLKVSHAVDLCTYHLNQDVDIKEKIQYLNTATSIDAKFFNMSSDDFYARNMNTYDIIFVDADHNYSGVSRDTFNALKIINKGGYIILHDIAGCEGVKRVWEEMKQYQYTSFVYSTTCGIGILKIN